MGVESIKVPKEKARRFLILRQGFLHEKDGKEGTLAAIRRLECVQTDPINAVHRNQHLVLHNRVRDYDVSYLDELLYKDRCVFEYWCNEKSIIPIGDFCYFSYRMKNPSQFHSPFYEHIKKRETQLGVSIAHVLTEIKKHGPLTAQDLERKGRMKAKLATDVLNLLWDRGDLMVHHVEGNRRCYGLTDDILPSSREMETPTKEEYERFIIRKYMRAYGLLDLRDWRFGWLPLKTPQRKAIIEKMVNRGELQPISVQGVRQEFYVLKELLDSLEDSDEQIEERIFFVAPLDNLLWNRRVITEIFDFTYSWEVYKVPERRLYGYYVMPILYATRFIGRLDPKLDRETGTLVIKSMNLSEKQVGTEVVNELALSLQRFSRFHSASRVCIEKTQPLELKDMLAHKLD